MKKEKTDNELENTKTATDTGVVSSGWLCTFDNSRRDDVY